MEGGGNLPPQCYKEIIFESVNLKRVVHGPCLRGAKHNNSLFEAKMARQLFNVANIKYRLLSGSGHLVRCLNRFGKFTLSSNKKSEKLFLN